MTGPTLTMDVMVATKEDIGRLEIALRELSKQVESMILIQERQTVQGQRIGDLETENGVLKELVNKLEKKVDTWIQRTVGAWFVLTVAGSAIIAFIELVRLH